MYELIEACFRSPSKVKGIRSFSPQIQVQNNVLNMVSDLFLLMASLSCFLMIPVDY